MGRQKLAKGKHKKEFPTGMAMEVLERRGTEVFVRTEKRRELVEEVRKHKGRSHLQFLKEIGGEPVGGRAVFF